MTNAEMTDLETLVHRAYPGWPNKSSGICSRHQKPGPADCEICWPNLNKLIDEHINTSELLYQAVLGLAGVTDPPNGRYGWKPAIEIIRQRLAKTHGV